MAGHLVTRAEGKQGESESIRELNWNAFVCSQKQRAQVRGTSSAGIVGSVLSDWP